MPSGGLFDPLGADRIEAERPSFRPSAPLVVAAVGAAAILILIGVAWLRDDGDRGEPRAVTPISRVPAPQKPTLPPPPAALPVQPPAGLPAVGADQEVEIQNGVRIIRPRRIPQGQAVPVGESSAKAP